MNQKDRQHEPFTNPPSPSSPPEGGESLEQLRAASLLIGAKGLEKIMAAVNPATSDAYNQAARQVNGQ